MNRNEILIEINNDKRYIDYCQRIAGPDIYKDLYQYVCLYLLEMDLDKLINLHQTNGLRMYITRIIYISINSSRSEFKRQLYGRLSTTELVENIESENTDYEEVLIKINNEIEKEITYSIKNNTYPADAKLFEIFIECGSYKEVALRTGIPYQTVRQYIQEFQKKIKSKI